jgi:hypothetical protein
MALVDVIIGYAKGAQGDVGPQGPTGPQGPEGPQGPLPSLVNNALSTTPGVAALDAAMGKTLQDHIDTTNSNLAEHTTQYAKASLSLKNSGQLGESSIYKNSSTTDDFGTNITDVNGILDIYTSLSLSKGEILLAKGTGISTNPGVSRLSKNNSPTGDFGTILHDENGQTNIITELIIINGELLLVKKMPDGTTSQHVIYQL